MIKNIDIIGALIVLSSYFFIMPVFFLAFFAFYPFLTGVVISGYGLATHTNKKWTILYLSLALGILGGVLLLMWVILPIIIVVVYIAPGLVASLSLMIAHFTKNVP